MAGRFEACRAPWGSSRPKGEISFLQTHVRWSHDGRWRDRRHHHQGCFLFAQQVMQILAEFMKEVGTELIGKGLEPII